MAINVQAIIRLTTMAETGQLKLLNQELAKTVGLLGQLNGQAGRAGQSIKDFSNNSATAMRQVGQGIMSIGAMWSIGITAPIVAAGKNAAETYATFDQGRAGIRAVTSDVEAMAAGFKNSDDAADKTANSILQWSKKTVFGAEAAIKTTLFA